MRSALETTLLNYPIFLAFLICDDPRLDPDLGLYVTVRQTREFLDKCIMDYGTVDTLEDVRKLTMHFPFNDRARFPGPLSRAIILFVRETNSAAVIFCGRNRLPHSELRICELINISSIACCSGRNPQ